MPCQLHTLRLERRGEDRAAVLEELPPELMVVYIVRDAAERAASPCHSACQHSERVREASVS